MRRSIPFLWGLVILLLILNLALLYGLNLIRLTVIQTLDEVQTTLGELGNEVIVYDIAVNQAVPIRADVPLNQTLEIPLQTTIPIDQELTVPFQMGSQEVELDMPVKADFPINMVVPVDFNDTIKVDTVVQLDTTVPVAIAIAQTPLAGYLNQARLDVAQLRSRLALTGEEAQAAAAAAGETDRQVSSELAPDTKAETAGPEATVPTGADSGAAFNPEKATANAAPDSEPEVGLRMVQSGQEKCNHDYWPLQPGLNRTYNSPVTSYSLRVDEVSNDQAQLTTRYENQPVQFSIACRPDGLGGHYLGDMRRLTELGALKFNNVRGTFLPSATKMEAIGSSWEQEFSLTGFVPASQGDTLVNGQVNRGRAMATYTATGFETVETPFGPQEALRVEQELDLKLNISFDLDGQTIPAVEKVRLENVYWFVKEIGLVQMHWQGGSVQQVIELDQAPVEQQLSIPALAPEQLVSICIQPQAQASECEPVIGIDAADVTPPPDAELDLPAFLLPDNLDQRDSATGSTTPAAGAGEASTKVASGSQQEEDQDNGLVRSTPELSTELRTYALAVEEIGTEITKAGETFGSSAISYRNDEITFDQFRSKFAEFAPEIEQLLRQMNALSPPVEAKEIHQKLTGGLALCEEAVDLMDEWFDTRNSGLKESTALLVADCMEEADSAVNELSALVGR